MRSSYARPFAAAVPAVLALTVWSCSDASAPSPSAPDGVVYAAASRNKPPIADAGGPYVGGVGMGIRFNGTASNDPDGPSSKLKYSWSFGDGTQGSGSRPVHAYAALGTYTVILRVTDAKGAVSAPDTARVSIEPNQLPVADAGGPYSGTAGVPVAFDGTSSNDPDERLPLSYSWRFGDGSTGSGSAPSHTYVSAGTFEVILVVTDAWGAVSAPDTTSVVIVPNELPIADAGGPYAGTAGTPMSFDGTGSTDPDGHLPLSYAWNFGDGTTGTGATPTHTYASAGVFDVVLVVTDANGARSAPNGTTATVASSTPTSILVSDAFARTVSGGWGTADVGGPWRIDADVISAFSVDGGLGRIVATSTRPRNVVATDGYGLNVTGLVSFGIDRMPDNPGRFYTVQVYARRDDRLTDGDNYYRFRVRAFGTGAMDARVEKNVNGVLAWVTDLTAITPRWAPGQRYWIRWECAGTSPATSLRIRVWADGSTEPTAWQIDVPVSEPALDVPGTTGIRVEGPNADQVTFPITFSFDNLEYRTRN